MGVSFSIGELGITFSLEESLSTGFDFDELAIIFGFANPYGVIQIGKLHVEFTLTSQ